jgi:plastocyanin
MFVHLHIKSSHMKLKFLLILAISFTFSCKKENKGTPGPNEIWLEYKAFNPTQLVVAVGTTVTFTNKDNANHSVTETSRIFDSGKIKSGNTYSYTFNTPGTYYFLCNYHSSNSLEQGAIRVQ